MALVDLKKPIVQRTVYLNVMYGLMILLSALVVGVLVAPEEVEYEGVSGNVTENFPRYQRCKLGDNSSTLSEQKEGQCRKFVGAIYNVDADPSFVPATADKELADTQQNAYGIAAAAVGVNAVLFAHTILQHLFDDGCSSMLVKVHQSVGVGVSLVNLGLFAGVVGLIYSVEGVANEDNFKYNVYYKDINIAYVAITGIVGSVVDLAFQLYLLIPHIFKSIPDGNAACWH